MARIGIITDIHNNAAALKLILRELEKRNCDEIICCGDIIGIGAYPEETVRIMRKLKNLSACVKGNHETFLFGRMPATFPNDEHMEYEEKKYHLWEHERLEKDSVKFLSMLPYSQTIEREGRKIYVAHYSMDGQNRYVNYHQNPSKEFEEKIAKCLNSGSCLFASHLFLFILNRNSQIYRCISKNAYEAIREGYINNKSENEKILLSCQDDIFN